MSRGAWFCLVWILLGMSAQGYADDAGSTYNFSIHHQIPKHRFTPHFAFGTESKFLSKYMWRGIPASLGAVWQPSAQVEYYGVGFNVWGNFVLDDEPNQGEFNEVDLTLYYHREFFQERLILRTWVYAALYPNGNPRSLDFGTGSLEGDILLTYHWDPLFWMAHFTVRLIDAPGALWWELGMGYQRELPLNFGVVTTLRLGMGDGRFNRAHIADVGTQFNLLEYSLSFPWEPLRGFQVIPNMHVSVILPEVLRSAMAQPTNVWGGVNFSYSLPPPRR